jgi:peptide chain release factor 3
MELEKQRGISVTSSVMQFPYRECMINLLDTPGHEDFSEDTYRTLTAVDSAVMVIDSVNGVEAQTIKLLNVCRMRDTPILTFINKLDREGKEPIDLLDEIESVLGIQCAPMTWPIGMGKRFRGVYHLYDDSHRLLRPAGREGHGRDHPGPRQPAPRRADRHAGRRLRMDIELVRGASHTFDAEPTSPASSRRCSSARRSTTSACRACSTPWSNCRRRRRPAPAKTPQVQPNEPKFSGFVFKIQANMDPKHRDRIAFLRVCSGRFERGMKVKQVDRQDPLGQQRHHLHGARPQHHRRSLAGRHHRHPQPRHHPPRRNLHRGRGPALHRHPVVRAGAFPPGAHRNPLKIKQLQKGLAATGGRRARRSCSAGPRATT